MLNQEPLVLIVIPAKNEADYIGQCLCGINSLNYSSNKVKNVVVDNCSTDNTAEIALQFGARVITSNVSSIAALRNLGASEGDSEMVGFVDADCIVDPDWLTVAARHFAADENLCAVGVTEAPPYTNSTWVETIWMGLKHGRKPTQGFAYTSWCASGAMLVKRESFEKVAGFNTCLTTCEDADLSTRLLENGTIILDYTVPFQHLRGSRTLLQLFKREMWRGQHNINGFLGHGISMRELPSVLAPVLFLFCMVSGMLLLILGQWVSEYFIRYLAFAFLGLALSLPFLMLVKKIGFPPPFKEVGRSYAVCFVYFLARALGSIFSGKRTW